MTFDEALEYANTLGETPKGYKDNEQIVLAAVTQDGSALLYASARLKDNEQVVLAAVTQTGWALEHASARLRAKALIVMLAIANDPEAAQYSLIQPH